MLELTQNEPGFFPACPDGSISPRCVINGVRRAIDVIVYEGDVGKFPLVVPG